MSRRGRRRSSRRKSSSSSKQSTKRNLKKDKDNFNNSELHFSQVNVLSVSDEESKQNGTPSSEKKIRLDQPNFSENPGKQLKNPGEKKLRIVTSVAIDNLKDSSPKIIFQQTQEPIFEDAQCSTFAITNVIKFNCLGSSLEDQTLSRHVESTKQNNINYNFSFSNVCPQKDAAFAIPARCENHNCCQDCYCNRNITLAGLSQSPLPTSYFSLQGPTMSHHTDCSSGQSWDLPSPNEFSDLAPDHALEELADDLATFNIDIDRHGSSCEHPSLFHSRNEMEMYDQTSDGLDYADKGAGAHRPSTWFDQLSESDNFEPLFMRPSLSISRSSFTMDFVNKHEQSAAFRNNSVSTFQHPTGPMRMKRRQTYPGTSEAWATMQDDLLPFREFFSSGTISPLTMQSLTLQAEKLAMFCQGDGSLNLYGTEVRHNSLSESCAKYQKGRQHGFDTESLEDTSEMAYGVGGLHNPRPMEERDPEEPEEQSTRPERALEDELLGPGGPGVRHTHGSLVIHVIPPSPCGSDDRREEGPPRCGRNIALRSKVKRKQATGDAPLSPQPHAARTNTVEPARRGLSITPQAGTQAKEIPELAPEEPDFYPGPERADLGSPVMTEGRPNVRKAPFSKPAPSHFIDETIQSCPDSQPAGPEDPGCPANTTMSHADDSKMDPDTEERRQQVCKTERSEKHNPVKGCSEPKERRKPSLHNERDSSGSDHWAMRRKLFKESSQWGSAGGGSLTSDITEDSVSDDTHSMDLSVRDIEERGFYTATFHYIAWTYRGDEVPAAASTTTLTPRPRPVSIRERTVRISKGMGEYPWGFRIQFSKPIVVTEVDTNGAAEEAGLMVGDYLLAVNGTDVSSIPHSEAAELARQGPDILTLTIGSDIAHSPNTPRPACRGYLHKRTQSGLIRGWRKRWFVLTHDCGLHYYRHKRDEAKGVPRYKVKLEGAEVGADISLGKPFVIRCCPQAGNRVYFLCATSNQEMKRWLEAMMNATQPVTQNHVWVDVTRHNSSLPPLAVKNPECLGLLYDIDKNKDMSRQHYCILKDGCLYFYNSMRSTHALGGMYLHGYVAREQSMGSKKSTIELKPPSDEFKTFYLCAENPNENKRWMEALKVSINKWQPLQWGMQGYQSKPPEETKM